MKKGCFVLLLAAVPFYLTACIIVFFLPVGGWATQHVVDKKLGRNSGTEALLPSGSVEQAPDQSVTIRALYRDTASTQVYCVETTVSPSTMRTLIRRSIRTTADKVPIVEITECLVVGDTAWLDQLPPGAEGRFFTSAWQNYSPGRTNARFEREHASFIVVRQLTFGEQSRAVAFEGRSHRYESWASWSTAAEKLLFIPATCFDVLTAPIQIPIYLAGDAVHGGLSLGGNPGNDNPWRKLDRQSRWPSPRLLDPTTRQVLVTAGAYEDLLYRSVVSEAGADEENAIETYRRYIGQFPDGRHVAAAEERISRIVKHRDKEEFDRGRNSLSLLTQFVETRPSSTFAPQAREILETLANNVAVMIRPEAAGDSMDSAGAETQRSPQQHFTIGVSTRAEVEAFMGRGEPVASPAHAGSESFTWQAVFHRGTFIPDSRYLPNESRLPIKPLTLTFGSDGVLTAIEGA